MTHDLILGPRVGRILQIPGESQTSSNNAMVSWSPWIARSSLVLTLAVCAGRVVLVRSLGTYSSDICGSIRFVRFNKRSDNRETKQAAENLKFIRKKCRLELLYDAENVATGSGCSKRPGISPAQPRRAERAFPRAGAASEEVKRTLRYVEPLSDARTKLGKRGVSTPRVGRVRRAIFQRALLVRTLKGG